MLVEAKLGKHTKQVCSCRTPFIYVQCEFGIGNRPSVACWMCTLIVLNRQGWKEGLHSHRRCIHYGFSGGHRDFGRKDKYAESHQLRFRVNFRVVCVLKVVVFGHSRSPCSRWLRYAYFMKSATPTPCNCWVCSVCCRAVGHRQLRPVEHFGGGGWGGCCDFELGYGEWVLNGCQTVGRLDVRSDTDKECGFGV